MKNLFLLFLTLLIVACNSKDTNQQILGHWKSIHGSLEGVEEITDSSFSIYYKDAGVERSFPYQLKGDSLFIYNVYGNNPIIEHTYLLKFMDNDKMLFISDEGSYQYKRISKEEFNKFIDD